MLTSKDVEILNKMNTQTEEIAKVIIELLTNKGFVTSTDIKHRVNATQHAIRTALLALEKENVIKRSSITNKSNKKRTPIKGYSFVNKIFTVTTVLDTDSTRELVVTRSVQEAMELDGLTLKEALERAYDLNIKIIL